MRKARVKKMGYNSTEQKKVLTYYHYWQDTLNWKENDPVVEWIKEEAKKQGISSSKFIKHLVEKHWKDLK